MPARPTRTDPAQRLAALEAELGALRRSLDHALERLGALEQAVSCDAAGNVSINAPGSLRLSAAAAAQLDCAALRLNTPMVQCSDVLKCSTLIATSVVASSYTPGAGNLA